MASDPLTAAEEALRWVAGDYNECNAGGHESPPSDVCAHHMAMDAARGLASVRARLAAAEAVVEAARGDTVCFDHADNCCADECGRCRDCARARIDLAAALAAYDKARGTR